MADRSGGHRRNRPARVWLVFSGPLIAATLIMFAALAVAGDAAEVEVRKIDFLIESIETLQNAQFIRNGSAYDGKAAAAHLRLKLRNAGTKIVTAEDFIRYCASGSLMSGVPYQIRFSDGRVVTSEEFLRHKLAEYTPEPRAGGQGSSR